MLRLLAVFVGVACLVGCAGAPVQEMSDARQAIAAAHAAGASKMDSQDYNSAQEAIQPQSVARDSTTPWRAKMSSSR